MTGGGLAAWRPTPAARWAGWVAALVALAGVLAGRREQLDQVHVVLPFLLLVLLGGATGGRALGLSLAGAAVLLLNYVFQPPYDTLVVHKPLDTLVLVSFLATAGVATQLLEVARARAVAARRHALEVERLAAEREGLLVEAEHAHALREADRMKDAVLAAVSHDLRTPLTTITALAHAAAARGDPAGPVIAEQAGRLSRMVADLLDLSRARAGSLPVAVEVNLAEDVVGAALRQTAGVLGERPVVVDVPEDGPPLAGRFDFVATLRVLGNLLENAHKYSPAGAPVAVGAAREGAALAFTVADRGAGVPAGERARIFAPFYRAAQAGGGPGDVGGAGLGLAVARALAEAQGGTLDVAERAGGGSVFTLRLAAADAEGDVPDDADDADDADPAPSAALSAGLAPGGSGHTAA